MSLEVKNNVYSLSRLVWKTNEKIGDAVSRVDLFSETAKSDFSFGDNRGAVLIKIFGIGKAQFKFALSPAFAPCPLAPAA